MPHPCYRSCYQVLRVPPHCDFADLRLAYRRRVIASHPDRFYAADPGRAERQEAELKRVIIAYRLLLTYLRRHGSLPPGDAPIEISRIGRPRPAQAAPAAGGDSALLWREIRGPWRRAAVWLLVAVLSTEVVATAWFRSQTGRTPAAPAGIDQSAPDIGTLHRAPLPNSTTSTVRKRIARSNLRL